MRSLEEGYIGIVPNLHCPNCGCNLSYESSSGKAQWAGGKKVLIYKVKVSLISGLLPEDQMIQEDYLFVDDRQAEEFAEHLWEELRKQFFSEDLKESCQLFYDEHVDGKEWARRAQRDNWIGEVQIQDTILYDEDMDLPESPL